MSDLPPDDEKVEPDVPTPAQLKKDADYQLSRLRGQFQKMPDIVHLGPLFVTQQFVDAAREAFDATEKVRILYELARTKESIAFSMESIEEKRRLVETLEGIRW